MNPMNYKRSRSSYSNNPLSSTLLLLIHRVQLKSSMRTCRSSKKWWRLPVVAMKHLKKSQSYPRRSATHSNSRASKPPSMFLTHNMALVIWNLWRGPCSTGVHRINVTSSRSRKTTAHLSSVNSSSDSTKRTLRANRQQQPLFRSSVNCQRLDSRTQMQGIWKYTSSKWLITARSVGSSRNNWINHLSSGK